MRLILRREDVTAQSTIGRCEVVGHDFACFMLEPPPTDERHPCIPAGVYEIQMRWSPRFGMRVPGLLAVPGRTDILIHPGNWPRDTIGCLLSGTTKETDQVTQSRKAYDRLIALIDAAVPFGPIQLEIRDVA